MSPKAKPDWRDTPGLNRKYCNQAEVEAIRLRLESDQITYGWMADLLGMRASHLSAMLKARTVMPLVYRYALMAGLVELHKRRRRDPDTGRPKNLAVRRREAERLSVLAKHRIF